ncbi:MAG: hypothetical protein ACK4KT_05730 [Thermaurantimonas sp.]
MRNILILVFVAGNTYAQIVGGYVAGTATSRSFREYADMINSNPQVTDKLSNFWFAQGFQIGFEFPNMATVAPFAFHYRRLTASAQYTSAATGVVSYRLRLNQYIVPVVFGGEVSGSKNFIFINIPVGYNSAKISHTMEKFPNFRRDYTGGTGIMGLGLSSYLPFNKRTALYIKMNWMGVILPIKELKPEMLDRAFYDNSGANYDDYIMSYVKDGNNEAVRVDFRGFDATLGIVYILY